MSLPHLHQIVLNSSTDGNSTYILDMDISCDVSAFAVAFAGASSGISLYDPLSGNCIVPTLSGHSDVINSITFSLSSPSHLISASEDQTVCLFDCRASSQPTAQITLDAEVYSAALGLGDTLIAVGTGSSVSFYDSRNLTTPLGSYADCHSDTVLKVKFHPLRSNLLHSTGEDGLICTYDTGVAAEEDAVVSICNTESPVRQLGFFGTGQEGIYGISTVETASCWHFPSSQRIGVFSSIREDFSADYVIDCWGSRSDPNGLFMAIGTHSGQAQVCSVNPSGLSPLWTLAASSESDIRGHSDTIRCCKKIDNISNGGADVLLTAGEDSKICMWQLSSALEAVSESPVIVAKEKVVNRLEDDTTEEFESKRRRRI